MVEYYPQILRQYLGKEREGSNELVDETTKHAAFIAGASQGTSAAAKGPEPYSRKERAQHNQTVRPLEEAALISFASQQGLWCALDQFLHAWRRTLDNCFIILDEA